MYLTDVNYRVSIRLVSKLLLLFTFDQQYYSIQELLIYEKIQLSSKSKLFNSEKIRFLYEYLQQPSVSCLVQDVASCAV